MSDMFFVLASQGVSTPPTIPTNLTATPQSGYNALSWLPSSGGGGIASYEVWGGNSANPLTWTLLVIVIGTTYNDSTYTINQIRYYGVKAVGVNGLKSALSTGASAINSTVPG